MHTPRKDPFSFNPEEILASKAAKKAKSDPREPNVFDFLPVLLAPRQVGLLMAQIKVRHPWILEGSDDPKYADRAQAEVFLEIGNMLRGFGIKRDKNLIGFLTVSLVSNPLWRRELRKKKKK